MIKPFRKTTLLMDLKEDDGKIISKGRKYDVFINCETNNLWSVYMGESNKTKTDCKPNQYFTTTGLFENNGSDGNIPPAALKTLLNFTPLCIKIVERGRANLDNGSIEWYTGG